MKAFYSILDFFSVETDNYIKTLVKNSYNSLRIVGRGTVLIDPKEVAKTKEFIAAKQRAAEIINID